MYAIYDGTHAVLFTKKETRNNTNVEVSKHTWLDWHLIPSKRPQTAPPNVKTNYVDIPGAHSKLDLSNVLTGAPRFENRSGSMEFILMNKSINSEGRPELEKYWWERYSEIMNFLHGQVVNIQFFDECSDAYFEKFNNLDASRPQPPVPPTNDFVDQFSNREWYWSGRVNVSGFETQNNYSTLTISYDVYPYKMKYVSDGATPPTYTRVVSL